MVHLQREAGDPFDSLPSSQVSEGGGEYTAEYSQSQSQSQGYTYTGAEDESLLHVSASQIGSGGGGGGASAGVVRRAPMPPQPSPALPPPRVSGASGVGVGIPSSVSVVRRETPIPLFSSALMPTPPQRIAASPGASGYASTDGISATGHMSWGMGASGSQTARVAVEATTPAPAVPPPQVRALAVCIHENTSDLEAL